MTVQLSSVTFLFMAGAGFKLDELADEAGVSARTIRYYIQRGLLAAPAFRGADTAYDRSHLDTLRAIKKLQEAFWPLDTIAEALAHRTPSEIARIARGDLVPDAPLAGELEPPAAPPRVEPWTTASPSRSRVERIRLTEGVELQLDLSAGAEARALAERIVRAFERGELSGDGRKKGGRR